MSAYGTAGRRAAAGTARAQARRGVPTRNARARRSGRRLAVTVTFGLVVVGLTLALLGADHALGAIGAGCARSPGTVLCR